ncbi:MAG: hypothetical protein EAX81_01205 [Candidatus Thorarchaeota archaeon]|nr:hypothetical protein [Candidatus Thorarchaeota archaeon]
MEELTMELRRTLLIVAIITGVAISIASAIYGWWLGQIIYGSMYDTKSGVSYWNTWTLDWNIFIASVFLAILSLITIPWRSSFISFISALSQTGPVRKSLDVPTTILWRVFQFGGFFLYYVATGGYSLTGQNVAFLMFLMDNGSISLSSGELSTLFQLPFAPNTPASYVESLIPAMEAYQLYVGLLGTFLLMSAARLVLSIITDLMTSNRDPFVVIAKGLLAVTFGIALELLGVPMWTVNAGTWMSYIALIIAMGVCLIGSFLFMTLRLRSGDAQQRLRSKIVQLEGDLARLQGELISIRQEYESGAIDAQDYRQRVELLMHDRASVGNELRRLKLERMIPLIGSPRRFGIFALFLIVVVVTLPAIQAVYYGIQMEGDKYVEWKFNTETAKEIEITTWAAGLEDMRILPLEDLTVNATPEGEVESLTTVRQWDQTASYLRMKNQIGTNWMELADSDIVYIKEHEYWIAPLTFDFQRVTSDFISQHLIYTHTKGLVVLDAYSGDIIENENLVALLNRTQDINMYYGEGNGFRGVTFVNVPGFTEVGNVTFSAFPDYVLGGFESFFYMLTMGFDAWSFLGREMDMLFERDVVSRVDSVLLQGLEADADPYIVVDENGNIFYAVSVFIDYRLATAYAQEDYMRFIGVVLVDIASGTLQFYKSPSEEAGFFLDSTYMSYYPWQDSPDWLQSQMKWPEDLYERQLEVAYIYHVTNGLIWRSGLDFHQMPEDSDTRYIIMRIGGEERFVAMHNSEFRDSAGRNLAGIYVMGCGNKEFGKLAFYKAGEEGTSTLLGPNAAQQAFETNDVVRTQLQLWGTHRYGNRLLYHLGGDLFFVIPVFLEVETSSNRVIEKLGGVGLVDAKTGERVELGRNIVEAYYSMFGLLNQTIIESGEVGIESAVFSPITIDSGEFADLVMLFRNNDNVSHDICLNFVVTTGNFSIEWHGTSITPVENPTNSTFTLDIGSVGPGDLYGTTALVAVNLPAGVVMAQYLVQLVLRTEEGVVDKLSLFLTVT